MAILTFEPKHDFWKRPFNLSTQNLLCIEYGHLDLSRHDLGKALYFLHPKFILLCMSILTLEQILIRVLVLVLVLVLDMKVLDVLKGTDHVGTFMGLKCVVYYANYRSGNQSFKIQVVP